MAVEVEIILKSAEKLLESKLEGKELFGDIQISDIEYEKLVEYLNEYVSASASRIRVICDLFPICITTFLVCLAKKEYNADFWGIVCERLGVEKNQIVQRQLGTCARKTFISHKFDISDADGPHIYIEPILLEAGAPPVSNLDQLFYILKYSNDLFDPQAIIDDLIDSRSYAIRKPLLRFLKRFTDTRAIDFIIEAHDAIKCVDMNMSGESQYVSAYEEWKENERKKENVSSRKKRENQARPRLTFEDGRRGLCMVLPRTILADEWLEEVKWVITTENGFSSEKIMMVTGDEESRYVDTIVVPVCPAESYNIQLVDNEGVGDSQIEPYTIKGIEKGKCIFFNSNGRMVNPTFLPTPYCIMVASDDVNIIDTNNLSVLYQVYPTDKEGYKTRFLESTGSGSIIKYSTTEKTYALEAKPQISMILDGETLFGLSNESKMFVKVPELILEKDEGVETEGLILRINNSGRDIKLENAFNDNVAVVSLPKTRFEKYGSYSLRLYRNETYIKEIELCYVPKIKSDYSSELSWKDGLKKEKKKFNFDKREGWELDFDNCVVKSDEESYIVECPENAGFITGYLYSTEEDNAFRCSFEMPISPFSADVVDIQGEIVEEATDKSAKIESEDILESINEYWLRFETFGNFENYSYKLQLVTVNGICQEEQIKGLRYGCCNFDLSVFYDTLKNNPLPAKIRLVCSNEEKAITLVTVKETVKLSKRPQYTPQGLIVLSAADENKDLVLRKFGDLESVKLPYKKSVLSKNGEKRGYPCGKLNDGLYTIDIDNSDTNIFDFEDETDIEFKGGINTIVVSQRKFGSSINSFSDWLEQTVYDFLVTPAKDLLRKINPSDPNGIKQFEGEKISKKDCEILIAFAVLAQVEKSIKIREFIKHIMRKISIYILSSKDRVLIIRSISEFNLGQDIFDICAQEYNFYLIGKLDNYNEVAEIVEVYSEEIALLIRLRNDDPIKNTIKKEKYRIIIGTEAIVSMLTVPGEKDVAVIKQEQKKFLAEKSPCAVEVKLSSEISGEMAPIMAMIVSNTKNPYLNLSKKPDTGVYFDRIRYVDQYLNWFKLNYDKSCEMHSFTKDRMVNAQKQFLNDVLSGFEFYNRRYRYVSNYNDALKHRLVSSSSIPVDKAVPYRFFYVLGLAAFLVNLEAKDEDLSKKIKSAERFLSSVISFAPKMTRRDILMAATYIYLVGKEK